MGTNLASLISASHGALPEKYLNHSFQFLTARFEPGWYRRVPSIQAKTKLLDSHRCSNLLPDQNRQTPYRLAERLGHGPTPGVCSEDGAERPSRLMEQLISN